MMNEDFEMVSELECEMCETPNEPMGSLGATMHYRCMACGWMYSEQQVEECEYE